MIPTYKIGNPEEQSYESPIEQKDFENEFKYAWCGCYWSWDESIYLYGLGKRFKNWLETVIHEEFHVVFDRIGNLMIKEQEYIINELLNYLGFLEVEVLEEEDDEKILLNSIRLSHLDEKEREKWQCLQGS